MKTKYSICYNPQVKNAQNVKDILLEKLNNKNLETDVVSIDNLRWVYDFVFVIGGDGTILKAARFFSKYDTSIFGINLGHLGFLSQASQEELDNAIESIINKEYKIENRMMLKYDKYIALNDFVIKGNDFSRACKFGLKINNKFVCEYFADGLIVSTPTGSTAYNMAAGGAILSPELNAIAIVPICPHTFSARPIIVSSDDIIEIYSPTSSQFCLSADGQEVFKINNTVKIQKSEFYSKLVLLNNNDFYSILRNKLHWGLSPAYKK